MTDRHAGPKERQKRTGKPRSGGRSPKGATVEAIVEIPRGSRNKYEMNHVTKEIHLDRVLYSSVHYPTDYGFIPGTVSGDGDPLDVLIIVEEPTFPGCHVIVRPIGVLIMHDENGLDEKLVAVPVADPRFDGILDIADLQPHWLREIENFFVTYKDLESDKETRVEGWKKSAEARILLERYREKP
jgi:inorganic pyrophosphatase